MGTERPAKAGDVVVKVTCRCGVHLIASWAAETWTCDGCRMRGRDREEVRLLEVGWEGDGEHGEAAPAGPGPVPSLGLRRLEDRAVAAVLRGLAGTLVEWQGRCRWTRGARSGEWCKLEGVHETPDGGRWCADHWKVGMGRWKRQEKLKMAGEQRQWTTPAE